MCNIDCIIIFNIAVILPPAIVFSEQAVMHCYLRLITMILLCGQIGLAEYIPFSQMFAPRMS